MATRTNYAIQKSLDLLYLNAAWTNIGDASGILPSAAAGNLYAALLKDGVEVNYGDYARVAIPRSGAGFSRTGNVVSNYAQINFPKSTGTGDAYATHVAICDASVGGNQLHLQAIGSNLPTTINCRPIIEAGQLTITGS